MSISKNLATAISKISIKLWLGMDSVADDILDFAFDIRAKFNVDDQAAKTVAESWHRQIRKIEKIIDQSQEFRILSKNDRESVLLTISEHIESMRLDSNFFANLDLSEQKLAKLLEKLLTKSLNTERRKFETNETQYEKQQIQNYNENLENYGRLVIGMVSPYIFSLASLLPDFNHRANQRILQRQGEMGIQIDQILNILDRTKQEGLDHYPVQEFSQKDRMAALQYRHISRNTSSKLSILGLDLPSFYTTSSIQNSYTSLYMSGSEFSRVSAEEAARRNKRLLIRGAPGSGKSTLLQWLTSLVCQIPWKFGSTGFDERIPFLIRTRELTDGEPPTLDQLPNLLLFDQSDDDKASWVDKLLKFGHGLLLVDGIDELQPNKRENFRVWIASILEQYPRTTCIVTSRPSAVEADWLATLDFTSGEILPLEKGESQTLIANWFRAKIIETLPNEVEQRLGDNPDLFRRKLLDYIDARPDVRALARTPLLCAMLCALVLSQRGSLPGSKNAIFEKAIEILLERREQFIEHNYSILSDIDLPTKVELVSEIAYYMMRNGKKVISREELGEICRRYIRFTKINPDKANDLSESIFERSGVLHGISTEDASFLHLSIQEFLCSKAVCAEGDVIFLVDNSREDNWREVCIFAAGAVENRSFVSQFFVSVFDRFKSSSDVYYSILLLNCLDNATWVDPAIRKQVGEVANSLLPPKDLEQAQALGSLGSIVLPQLGKHVKRGLPYSRYALHSICLVGGQEGIDVISERWGELCENDLVEAVHFLDNFPPSEFYDRLLVRWGQFDVIKTSNYDLIQLLDTSVSFNELNILDCDPLETLDSFLAAERIIIRDCQNLIEVKVCEEEAICESIEIHFCGSLVKLTLENLEHLLELEVSGSARLSLIDGLAGSSAIEEIYLSDCSGSALANFRPSPNLRKIVMRECWDIPKDRDYGSLILDLGVSNYSNFD